jgi:N-dimethylarginine dimethylaminohydrolase
MSSKVYTSADDIDFTLNDVASMPLPTEALMVQPSHFSVDYVINPHMTQHVGKVDKKKAYKEWEVIRDTFAETGLVVHELEGQPGLPDMVFCANQSLPFVDKEGHTKVLMSIMHADERKEEVPYIEQWYRQHGYEVNYFDEDSISDFEGMGDAIWHTGKRMIWGGYGYRSDMKAYEHITELYDVPVLALELVSESFYHLDTCLCMLNSDTALIYPAAFTDEGLAMIRKLIPNIIEANQKEAEELFACNATCPDGKNVVIQEGCTEVNAQLEEAGFKVHEVSTEEYLKSGGSVFCMKMLLW